jgi:hypothetical protein
MLSDINKTLNINDLKSTYVKMGTVRNTYLINSDLPQLNLEHFLALFI